MGAGRRPGETRLLLDTMLAKQQAEADALRVVLAWNERLADKRLVLFSPTIRAALLSGYHWLSVCCPSCETVASVDLTMVRRPADMTIHQMLPALACRFCGSRAGAIPIGLQGPQGTREPPPKPPAREVEIARVLAEALTRIAVHGVGKDAIRSVHEMSSIAERALEYVGVEWLQEIKRDR